MPLYETKEEPEMTQAQSCEMFEAALEARMDQLKANGASSWADPTVETAVGAKVPLGIGQAGRCIFPAVLVCF